MFLIFFYHPHGNIIIILEFESEREENELNCLRIKYERKNKSINLKRKFYQEKLEKENN